MIDQIEPKAVAGGVAVYCAHDKITDTDSLIGNPRNPNKHPKDQITALAKIIKRQGWRHPIVVSNRSGFVVKGHGRLLATKEIGVLEVPYVMKNGEKIPCSEIYIPSGDDIKFKDGSVHDIQNSRTSGMKRDE